MRNHRSRLRRLSLGAGLATSVLALGACSATPHPGATQTAGSVAATSAAGRPTPSPVAASSSAGTSRSATTTPASTTSAATAAAPAPSSNGIAACTKRAQSMTAAQLATQVLMMGISPAAAPQGTAATLVERGVGGVFYTSQSGATTATVAATSKSLQQQSPFPLLIAVDQEGGQVQGLRGQGFSAIPPAVQQSQLGDAVLTERWKAWAAELRAAGVNLNLAPVADVTPAGTGGNPPVADIDRGYGSDPATVTARTAAVLGGLGQAGVGGTLKHFPGLGRVSVNTDFGNAVDAVTTLDDPLLQPFYANLGKTGVVMVSLATYPKIAPSTIAAFSPKVFEALRAHGFNGVIMSDDMGAAAAVQQLGPGERAIAFLSAGGDLALAVTSESAAAMAQALETKAASDPAFAALLVDRAAIVLGYKQQLGLATC